ncbi:MAG: DUF2796 domain-containing protein [Sulfitobacter sp.]
MIRTASAAMLILSAGTLGAEENRQLDAHEHGVGQLDIAFDGDQIAMALHAPGADIVGFEYAAQSAEDRAKVDAAVANLAKPLDLFALPAAAGCSVVQASASLESEEAQDDHAEHEEDHDHDEHAEDDHKDEDNAAHDEEHDHDEHAEDDHKDEDHTAHDEEHDHDEHAENADHSEFHAEYLLKCADPAQATLITFTYFDTFPNALELEVQVISDRGATAFEVEKDAPILDLREIF